MTPRVLPSTALGRMELGSDHPENPSDGDPMPDDRPDDLRDDVRDIRIAGCPVHLTYHAETDGRWTMQGTIRCGVADRSAVRLVTAGPHPERDTAEQNVLDRIGQLLGHNVDRNTSRVKNWE